MMITALQTKLANTPIAHSVGRNAILHQIVDQTPVFVPYKILEKYVYLKMVDINVWRHYQPHRQSPPLVMILALVWMFVD